MALIPWQPFWDIERMFEESFPEMTEEKSRKSSHPASFLQAPKVDVYEKEGNLIVEADMPGVDPESVDVEIRDNTLFLQARREEKKEEKKKGYYRRELRAGYYKRAIPLPVEVMEGKAAAEFREGILKVTMPKAKKGTKEKGVKVKVKGEKKS